ncbi:MAG: 6-bladed beta-propeller [Candidatus Aminicenantes bacterium]|nr:6-bladed beta-propeller [Candidatus Aminicenantes bacterium]
MMKINLALIATGGLLIALMAGRGTAGQRSVKRHAARDIKLDFKTDDDAVFSRPVSISHDRDAVYVIDAEENEVRVFSKTGAFVRVFGRKGQGPGEFDSPADLDVSGDRIYVTDRFNKRVQVLDRKGGYLGGFRVPFTPDQICVLSAGRIILSHLPMGSEGPEPMVHGFSEKGDLLWEHADSYYSGDGVYDTFRNFVVMVKGDREDVLVVHKSDERGVVRFDKEGKSGAPVRVADDYKFKRISLPVKGPKRQVSGFCWDASFDGGSLGLLAPDDTKENDLGPGRAVFLITPDGLVKDIIDLPAAVTRIDMDGDDIYAIDTENSLRVFRRGQR